MRYSVRYNMQTQEVVGSRPLSDVTGRKPSRPWSAKEEDAPCEIIASPDLIPSNDNDDVTIRTSRGEIIVKLWDISSNLKAEDAREIEDADESLGGVIEKVKENPKEKARLKAVLERRLAELGAD